MGNRIIKIDAVNLIGDDRKLRVAAYCRVSSDSKDQKDSFVEQVRYYNDFISSNDYMDLVDIYADEGISGTSVSKRDEFLRMVKDCRNGKIDKIYVKSVSRFARNALECIEYIRLLKQYRTTVYFENDNIDTSTMNNEIILLIKSIFAQSEALANSKRAKRSFQMRMESGNVAVNNIPYGYDCIDGVLVPNSEKGEIVKRIYEMYLSGIGAGRIAYRFNSEEEMPDKPWSKEKVHYILTNEKYIGDSLHQKTYTSDQLPSKKHINYGQLDKYYISNTHEPILDKKTFYAVKEILNRNLSVHNKKSPVKKHKFTGSMYCSSCGRTYKKSIKNGIVYWICSKTGTIGCRCDTHPIAETAVESTFCNFYNKLKYYSDDILKKTLSRLEEARNRLNGANYEISVIDREIIKLADSDKKLVALLNDGQISSETYERNSAKTKNIINELRVQRKKYLQNDENEECMEEFRALIVFLEECPKAILDYDPNLFRGIVRKMVVEPENIAYELKCGLVLREAIAWN